MKVCRLVAVLAAAPFLAGCAGSSTTTTVTPTPMATATPASNVLPVAVGGGPAGNVANALFASVTVCVPGSSDCQTIDGVLVDTGSVGLRLVASQVALSLPQIRDDNAEPIGNCTAFVDLSYAWGPMVTADVRLAGEVASAVPIQLIGTRGLPAAPATCSQGGTALDTVQSLSANGILGIGLFRQDCGAACTGAASTVPALYFACPGGACSSTAMPLSSQLQNPVWLFAQDNNGALVRLPGVPATGAAAATGSLIFGIGTRANNDLGSARVYTTDRRGMFTTTFRGSSYPRSYIDSGSNGIFFLDAATIGVPACPDGNSGFSCPASTLSYTASNTGANGTSSALSFSVANAATLLRTGNTAFDNLCGPDSGAFDWGLPFFFGRTVFVAIEGQSTPGGPGPYWAY